MSVDADMAQAPQAQRRLTYENRRATCAVYVKCSIDKSRPGRLRRPDSYRCPASAATPAGRTLTHPGQLERQRFPAFPAPMWCEMDRRPSMARKTPEQLAHHQSPRQAPMHASIRSAGAVMAGRSRPARAGTPPSANHGAPPHTPILRTMGYVDNSKFRVSKPGAGIPCFRCLSFYTS